MQMEMSISLRVSIADERLNLNEIYLALELRRPGVTQALAVVDYCGGCK